MLPVEFSSVIYCSYVQIVDLTICNIFPIQEIIIFIYLNNNIYKRIIKKEEKKNQIRIKNAQTETGQVEMGFILLSGLNK